MRRKPPPGNVRRVQPIDGNVRYTITNKTGRIVQCESHLERKLALRIERDKTIKDYSSQPETFYFIDRNRKKHHYTPDFIAWLTNSGVRIYEVTIPERRKNNPNIYLREEGGRNVCAERGWEYVVETPETLPGDTETANLLGFYICRPRAYRNNQFARLVLNELVPGRPVSVNELVHLLTSKAEGEVSIPSLYSSIYHMIWHDELKIEWQKLFFIDAAPARNAQVWRD